MIRVTFEFTTVDAAIVALGKFTSAAPAKPVADSVSKTPAATPPVAAEPKRKRKPRADAGKKRGSYKQAAASATPSPESGEDTGDSQTAVTGSSKAGGQPTNSTPTPADAPEAAKAADTNTAAPSLEDAQSALKALFEAKGLPAAQAVLAKFGVARLGELPEGKRVEFIEAAQVAA